MSLRAAPSVSLGAAPAASVRAARSVSLRTAPSSSLRAAPSVPAVAAPSSSLRAARSVPAVAALFVDELERDMQGVALPRPEIHLVVRYGPSTNNGLDVYAMGGRQSVHRKRLPGGQRVVTARLQLGTAEAVLGVPALAIAGRVVPLDALWGDAPTRRLLDALADARDLSEASRRLERAIAERLTSSDTYQARNQLVLDAAGRLPTASVSAVADDLGLSERHLRRVFREALGVGPKTYAKLLRFRDALRVARAEKRPGWARIAATAGYYDQAHLIAEFRAFAGVTPQALWAELRVGYSLG